MKPKLLPCLALLLSSLLTSCSTAPPMNGTSAAADSFLQWIDATNYDNSLITDSCVSVSFCASPAPVAAFSSKPGEAFMCGYEKKGDQIRELKCIDGPSFHVHTIPLLSIPSDAEMIDTVECTQGSGRAIHFFTWLARRPETHIVLGLDSNYNTLIISNAPVEGWQKYYDQNYSDMNNLGIIESTFQRPCTSSRTVPWPGSPADLMFGEFDNAHGREMYIFNQDHFLGVRKVAVFPLGSVFFVPSGDRVLLKTWFWLESGSQNEQSVQTPAAKKIGTAVWAINCDRINYAEFITGRWLLVACTRGDEDTFYMYNMNDILNRAAERVQPGGKADW